jgi:hypothetical protein
VIAALLSHPLTLPVLALCLWCLLLFRAVAAEEDEREALASDEAWQQGREMLTRGKVRTLHGRGAVLPLRD